MVYDVSTLSSAVTKVASPKVIDGSNQKASLSGEFSKRSTAEISVPWLLGNLRRKILV